MIVNDILAALKEIRDRWYFSYTLKKIGILFTRPNSEMGTAEWIESVLRQMEEKSTPEFTSQLLRTQTQMHALQSQINPHFLYNTLEMIRNEAYLSGADRIADMTESLSDVLRYSVNSMEGAATVEEEMENVRKYFQIQQYRFRDKFLLIENFDHSDRSLMECLLPRLSLQPLVENAIFHGLEPKLTKGTIQIRIFSTGNRLVIRISDDGVGMSQTVADGLRLQLCSKSNIVHSESENGTGIALLNVNRRIKLTYGDDYGLSFSSIENQGTIFELTVPLRWRKPEDSIYDPYRLL